MSKVSKIFRDQTTIIKHVQIKHLFFPIWRFQHFKDILQNPKIKQMATRFSNHSEGHQNPISGLKGTAILLKGWILPIGGASAGEGLRL